MRGQSMPLFSTARKASMKLAQIGSISRVSYVQVSIFRTELNGRGMVDGGWDGG